MHFVVEVCVRDVRDACVSIEAKLNINFPIAYFLIARAV
jgi:hypothetical protein